MVGALFSLQPFVQHAATQEGQQTKSNPMVEGLYQTMQIACSNPSQYGHESLEESEGERDGRCCAATPPTLDDAAGDGYGEAVHRQC